jgi:predicted GIY-YIG superfamily endonuclease
MEHGKRYYVYILASKSRVLYVGVTGFLLQRVLQHKAGDGDGFTGRYRVWFILKRFDTSIMRSQERPS